MSERCPISILIPAKNERGNLQACIESARFADEIVVVDSGSTDGSDKMSRTPGAFALRQSVAQRIRPASGQRVSRLLSAAMVRCAVPSLWLRSSEALLLLVGIAVWPRPLPRSDLRPHAGIPQPERRGRRAQFLERCSLF